MIQMKQIIFGVAIFVVATFFVLEAKVEIRKPAPSPSPSAGPVAKLEEKRAIFLSYIEYQERFDNKNEQQLKQEIDHMIQNMKEKGFNMLLLHVRPFSDAIYPSNLFPSSKTIVGVEGEKLPFDLLAYFIEKAHTAKIEVHAWINPYRIRNTTDVSSISIKNPCYKWLGSDLVHVIEGKGIYYNPASPEVQKLIVSGIEELVEKYDLDGIHFDDYFYPNDTIDDKFYEVYKKNGGTLSKQDYHFENTNQLIRQVYQTVHKKKGMVFGVSPEGNIDNNYDSNFIDTKKWLREKGYVDYIMPQIYFGFENSARPFRETLKMWNNLIVNKEIQLLPALAFYKVGTIDQYALAGKEEWLKNDDIMAREVEESRTVSQYAGFSLFRYGSIFDDQLKTETTFREKENLFQVLQ